MFVNLLRPAERVSKRPIFYLIIMNIDIQHKIGCLMARIANIAKVSDVTKKSGKVTNVFLLYLLSLC